MTLAERGLFRDLLDYCYANGSIPADEVILSRIAACSNDEFSQAWPRVKTFFTASGDGNILVHPRAVRENERLRAFHRERSRSGQRGGKRSAAVRKTGTIHTETQLEAELEAEIKPSTSTSTSTSQGASSWPTELADALREHASAIGCLNFEEDATLLGGLLLACGGSILEAASLISKLSYRRFGEHASHRQPWPNSLRYWQKVLKEELAANPRSRGGPGRASTTDYLALVGNSTQ